MKKYKISKFDYDNQKYYAPFSHLKVNLKQKNKIITSFYEKRFEIANKIKDLLLKASSSLNDNNKPKIPFKIEKNDKPKINKIDSTIIKEDNRNLFKKRLIKAKEKNYQRYCSVDAIKGNNSSSLINISSKLLPVPLTARKKEEGLIEKRKVIRAQSSSLFLTNFNNTTYSSSSNPFPSRNIFNRHNLSSSSQRGPTVDYKSLNYLFNKSMKTSETTFNAYKISRERSKMKRSRTASVKNDNGLKELKSVTSFQYFTDKRGHVSLLHKPIYDLLSFGDCSYKMSDCDFYTHRKLMTTAYPPIQQRADIPNKNPPEHDAYMKSMVKKNHKHENNFNHILYILHKSRSMLAS